MAAKQTKPPPQSSVERKRRKTTTAPPQPPQSQPIQHASLPRLVASHPVRQRVFVFGDGDCGQLGLGEDITEKLRPGLLEIDATQSVLQVVCGGMHTLALMEDGTVYSWGVNDEGALGRRTPDKVWTDVSESSFGSITASFTGANLSLLTSVGDPYTPGRVPFPAACAGKKCVQLSAGDSHSVALFEDGSVASWGTFRDGSGVMGFGVETHVQLVPTVVYAPDARQGRPAMLSVSSGADHVCGLTGEGTVVSWGSGQQGQLGRVGVRMSERMRLRTFLVPTVVPLKKTKASSNSSSSSSSSSVRRFVVDVACGTYSSFFLMSDGSLYACGLNNYGQLGITGDNDGGNSGNSGNSDNSDNAVVHVPTRVAGADGVVKVFPGQHHTLFLTSDKRLLSCGRPTYGRLGQRDADVGSDVGRPTLAPVDGRDALEGRRVAGAAAGLAVSGCFDTEGNAYTWGFGTSNQLIKGDDDEDEVVPKKVASTKRFQAHVVGMDFGGQHGAMVAYDR